MAPIQMPAIQSGCRSASANASKARPEMIQRTTALDEERDALKPASRPHLLSRAHAGRDAEAGPRLPSCVGNR